MSEQTEQPQTTVLYRPTGDNELALIRQLNFRAFPQHLYWQPIFYPVLFEEYARQIARDWNARDGKRGYVTRFAVETAYLAQFEIHQVGSSRIRNTGSPRRSSRRSIGILWDPLESSPSTSPHRSCLTRLGRAHPAERKTARGHSLRTR